MNRRVVAVVYLQRARSVLEETRDLRPHPGKLLVRIFFGGGIKPLRIREKKGGKE